MSAKPFESFLTGQFFIWSKTYLRAGYRYQFQSPDSANSQRLHQAFIAKTDTHIVVKETTLSAIKCGDINLIPVLHNDTGDGYSENFISHLRDEIASQQGALKGAALLVIHNSMLDTLINSAADIAQVDCVWHPAKIKAAMRHLIDNLALSQSNSVSECLLDQRFEQIIDDGATMFGFEELYNAVLGDELEFGELGLLTDPAIFMMNDKANQIANRLDENKDLYEKLDFITHHFPNDLTEKLAEEHFGEKFVEKHFGGAQPESWRTDLDLSDCLQEQKRNRQHVLTLEKETTSQGEIIAKQKSESKAGQRERHLIILLTPGQTTFNLELSFVDGKVEQKQCKIKHNTTNNIVVAPPNNTGGKRSRVSITGDYQNTPVYFSFELKREATAECYKFRTLILQSDDFFIDGFRNSFLVEPAKQRVTLQTEDTVLAIAEQGASATLTEIGQVFDNVDINEIDFEQVANESDELHFIVKGQNAQLTFNVEGAVATESLTLPLMLDVGRFVRLYQDDYFGCFNRLKSKVLLDNKEVAPKGRRLTLLQ